MMHHRGYWLRRGLAGFGLAVPLALAPTLEVTVNAADRHSEPRQLSKARPGSATASTAPRRPDDSDPSSR